MSNIIIQVLMQLEGKRLRNIVSFLELISVELELKRIPHFTTINKFSLRIKSLWIEGFILNLIKSNESAIVAIDGTGFSLIKRSTYFSTIAGEIKRFIQCVASADVKRKLVTAVRLRRKRRNENIDVNYLMKKTSSVLPAKVYLGDKLYDSEKNHELAKKYNAKFIAPLKNKKVPLMRTKGIHRKRLKKNFPKKIYNKRSIIESIFSVIKRRFGSLIYPRKFKTQKNELLFRIMAYNVDRLVNNPKRLFTFYKASL